MSRARPEEAIYHTMRGRTFIFERREGLWRWSSPTGVHGFARFLHDALAAARAHAECVPPW